MATLSTLDRLADKFTVGDGCWEWTAYRLPNGYGTFWTGTHKTTAHRAVYEALVGPIPAALELDHLCRNRGCVRPDHLEPVTGKENVRRGVAGLVNGGRNRAKTHCPAGHGYSGDNLYTYKDGRRICRTCDRARKR